MISIAKPSDIRMNGEKLAVLGLGQFEGLSSTLIDFIIPHVFNDNVKLQLPLFLSQTKQKEVLQLDTFDAKS